jgi:hypothetical protein
LDARLRFVDTSYGLIFKDHLLKFAWDCEQRKRVVVLTLIE